MQIYTLQNDEQFGPFSFEEIRIKMETGECDAGTLSWHEGLEEWLPLNDVIGINKKAEPLSRSETNDGGTKISFKERFLQMGGNIKNRLLISQKHVSGIIGNKDRGIIYNLKTWFEKLFAECAAKTEFLYKKASRPQTWFQKKTNVAILTVAGSMVALFMLALLLWAVFEMLWYSRIIVFASVIVGIAIWGLKQLFDAPTSEGTPSNIQQTKNLKVGLGLAGSIILFLGVFMPIASVPIQGNVNFFREGSVEAWLILTLAVSSFVVTVKKKYNVLWWTGVSSMIILAITYLDFQHKFEEIRAEMDDKLEDNPFRFMGDIMMNSFQLQWGWVVLVLGAALVIASVAISDIQKHDH
jgi:hypothetical protein